MSAALLKRYEALSLRERALVMAALLGLLIVTWNSLFMEPLLRTRANLKSELEAAGKQGADARNAEETDPRQVNLRRASDLQIRLAGLDAQLMNSAKGFVSANRMIQVLHDVLDAQGRLELVSIRNLPVTSLIPPAPVNDAAAAGSTPAEEEMQPPFVHAVEIVIDGQYGDILDYLATLESMPWKFRWKSLDLSTKGYPRNRVRIEIATLSLDSTWLGV